MRIMASRFVEELQIINSYKDGGKAFSTIDYTTMVIDREAEDYYNQTFNQ